MKLYFTPSKSPLAKGFYAVAQTPWEALEVFKEYVDQDTKLEDLVVVDQQITLPNKRKTQKRKRILNTDAGLIDIDIVEFFDEPTFFGVAYKSDPYGVPEIALSPEAWEVYNDIEYEPRWRIAFQANDFESGLKIRVDDGGYVVWMYTYETDELYHEAYMPNEEKAIEFALSLLRDAKILRRKYRRLSKEAMEESLRRVREKHHESKEKIVPLRLIK